MALDMEVSLGPGHIVLDGEPVPSPNGGRAPNFRPILLSPNGWMNQDGTWHGGGGLSPSDFVLDGDPGSPTPKGHSPPIFGRCPLWPNDWID